MSRVGIDAPFTILDLKLQGYGSTRDRGSDFRGRLAKVDILHILCIRAFNQLEVRLELCRIGLDRIAAIFDGHRVADAFHALSIVDAAEREILPREIHVHGFDIQSLDRQVVLRIAKTEIAPLVILYLDLQGQYLARRHAVAILVPLHRDNHAGDIGRSRPENQRPVGHHAQHALDFGRMFVCDIDLVAGIRRLADVL